VAAAGGQLAAGCEGVEVSPLVSYAGEGLQELVQGTTLQVHGPVGLLASGVYNAAWTGGMLCAGLGVAGQENQLASHWHVAA
jgi:hypothetical protein